MDIAALDKMRQEERLRMEHTALDRPYSRQEALEALHRIADGKLPLREAVSVLDQIANTFKNLGILELPWWRARDEDARKLFMLYYYECHGFRMVGTYPAFEDDLNRRANSAQCRKEFGEVLHYLRPGRSHSFEYKIEDEKPHEKRSVNEDDIDKIYHNIRHQISEYKERFNHEADDQIALENRIIAARNVIYDFSRGSATEMSMEAVAYSVAVLICTHEMDDELLEIGWARTDQPEYRLTYLLAFYLLYGKEADCKYQQLREYVDQFADSEKRKAEIQQVQSFISGF